jgi:hypothetical protein
MAKQMGYVTPKPADPAAAANGAANGGANGADAHAVQNGAGAANGANQQQPNVADEIARIAQGQAANKSLSDAGGAPNGMTLEALANMPQSDFDKLYKSKKTQIDALMAGR